jgi:hypothetical protein
MHTMFRILGSVLFLSVMLLLNACEDSTEGPSITSVSSSPEVSTLISTTPVANVETSIRSKIQSIHFSDQNSSRGRVFKIWQASDVPHDPFHIVYHLEDVSMNVTFAKLNQAERQWLTDHIRIEGNVEWKIDESPNSMNEVRFQFRNASKSFILHLGDLPAITFIRKEPVSYSFGSGSGHNGSHLLLWAKEYVPRLLIPEGESKIELVFSEEMQTQLPTTMEGVLLTAEWVDSRHLLIQLDAMDKGDGTKEQYMRMDNLLDISGNRLEAESSSLMVQQVPKYVWRNVHSGELAGGGPRDQFYDQLVLSDNKQSYVGIVRLGGSMGDGDGTSYAFILEQKGKGPVVIENVFYSTIEPEQQPIHWMDEKTLIYSSYYGVYAYDIEKREKRILHHARPDEKDNVNYASYDTTRGLLHILAYENRHETNQLERITYKLGETAPQRTKAYTSTTLVSKYSNLDMSMIPTVKGTYWTRLLDGVPYTDFMTDSGEKLTTAGIAQLVTKQGAYLQLFQKGANLQFSQWKIWQPGQPAKVIANPPEDSYTYASGTELFSKHDDKYYRYDASRNKWVIWQAPNGEKDAEPVRGKDGLYRTKRE